MVGYSTRLVALALIAASAYASKPAREASPTSGDCSPDADEHRPMGMRANDEAHHGVYGGAAQWATRFDDPARDAWQRPDDVIRALDLEPSMTVADVGAGTGYFAVRLARAVPEGKVIATDLEPDMVRYLEDRARREQLPNLRAIRATRTTSGLAPNSVDALLVVHVWHHVAARSCYARDLAAALRPGGRLIVVEFRPDAQKGPPMKLRLAPERVIADFVGVGLSATLSPISLPDQYLIEVRRDP